ncbi:transposase [Cohnella sp. WQ 127256]|uniref:transposase n=1 Tax=Cohnella sp. WQ 127256 TaxID=2938790 RepID=UPI0021194E40|nr:transposase [Cohnella sp. WQ 127256]
MNRRDFLKSAFANTFKEIISPLIERDIEKLDQVAETFSGTRYYRISYPKAGTLFDEVTVQMEPLIVMHGDNRYYALSKKCPGCGQLLNYLAYQRSFKCFSCDREATLSSPESFESFPTKIEDGHLHVGIPSKEVPYA